ncbi:hypothetical protein [Nocardioides kribbensis]|uniref:hypothetical protein n=1 Tax=Nocardioides kribbensis TaxID=305517 RepID=UPI0018792C54|nr:hypothetical protein [Nocardioides kribbensis]
MSHARRLRAVLVAAVLVALPVSTVAMRPVAGPPEAGPGRAEESALRDTDVSSYLAVSRDRAFDTAWDGPVWGRGVRWVPGDRRAGDFWVRNDGPAPADLTLTVASRGARPLLSADRFSVRVAGRARRGAPSGDLTRSLARVEGSLRRTAPVVLAYHLRPGRLVHVRVIAALAYTAGNRTQGRGSRVSLELRLTQDVNGFRDDTVVLRG